MDEAIGGYFGLELRKGEHYHKNALKLNTARNCFEYILRAKRYHKVYIPYYTCEVMLEPLQKCGVDYEFYHINMDLEPVDDFQLQKDDAFLYTNYFGLKHNCAKRLSLIYGKSLIVDNAHAFFAEPIEGIDTFYSARKFFGVPDGAYLYTDTFLDEDIPQDVSYLRCAHLLKRIDLNAEDGYQDFRSADDSLIGQPIKRMSKLTKSILGSIDYEMVKNKRVENYNSIHKKLGKTNQLQMDLMDGAIPMVYPYYIMDKSLRQTLIDKKIFVATYWPNVFDWCKEDSIECNLAKYILPLPIDQRYNDNNMNNDLIITIWKE